MRHARRPSERGRSALRFVFVSVIVLALSASSVAAIAIWQTVGNIAPGIHLAQLPGQTAVPPGIGAAEGEVNLLLVGTDTRTGQGGGFSSADNIAASSGAGSNDVTMLLHISKDHTNASVVSFPRDLMVAVPGCPQSGGTTSAPAQSAMFNTTLSTGGLPCVVLTVEQLTGITIPYAAEISFDGVIAMSNAVGGVSVCLATPVDDSYTGLHLAAGQQTLVGADALAFVRSRHGVGDGSDLGRISNQQVFLSALMRKIASAGVLTNPVTLYSLANAALTNMQLSDTLSNVAAPVSIALALQAVSLPKLVFLQYPTTADPTNPNRVVADSSPAQLVNTALQTDQPLQLTGGVGRAAVADPSAAATPTPIPTPTPSSAGSASASPSAAPGVSLPTSVTGQTAAEATCTKGS
ncbi:MAG: LytR family transcriptional regulator [Subtercola sp.]|nr:LytR family transcriptional regulator [Subtercola sp.]